MKNADIFAYRYIRVSVYSDAFERERRGGLGQPAAEAFFAARDRVVAALFLIYNKKP